MRAIIVAPLVLGSDIGMTIRPYVVYRLYGPEPPIAEPNRSHGSLITQATCAMKMTEFPL